MFSGTTLLALLAVSTMVTAQAQSQWSIDSLSAARGKLAAATVGNLVLFAGGDDPWSGSNSDVVDIFDTATGTKTTETLSVARAFLAGTSVREYALFAGGGIDSMTPLDVVDAYDTQSMSWVSGYPLSEARSDLAATTVGDKAIFAGGTAGGIAISSAVDIYDAALGTPDDAGAWSTTTLSAPRAGLAAVTVGDLAIFAGGVDATGTLSDRVDIYDNSTGTWTWTTFTPARAGAAAVAVGDLAYFAGGQVGQFVMTDVISIYNAQTGVWTETTLPEQRAALQATALGNTLIFAGGFVNTGTLSTTVHMYNTGTGQWDSSSDLTQGRWAMGVGAAGGKALFAGGRGVNAAPASDRVDIYEPLGQNYCAATPNSTGGAASISATGSNSVAANDLTLTAQPVPDQPGLFFYGPVQVEQPFGNGILCIGTAGPVGIARLPVVNAAGGVLTHTVDNTSPPTLATRILPGSTWHFQAWFRDPVAMGAFVDLSDALSVQFTP